MEAWVWGFASGAVLYAAAVTAAGVVVAGVGMLAARLLLAARARARAPVSQAVSQGVSQAVLQVVWRPVWQVVPLVFVTLVFVFLTQHPFPDPASLVCPTPEGRLQLQPFQYWEPLARLWAQGADAATWAGNRTVASAVMNLVVCAGIGMVLAGQTARLIHAALFGAGLTLAVETTQLTGIWGLYPCAYRQFSVDDLMLNATGVVLGFVLGRVVVEGVHRMRNR